MEDFYYDIQLLQHYMHSYCFNCIHTCILPWFASPGSSFKAGVLMTESLSSDRWVGVSGISATGNLHVATEWWLDHVSYTIVHVLWKHGDFMVSALHSELSGLGSSPAWGHCDTSFSLTVPLSTQVSKSVPWINAGGNPAILPSYPDGYRNWDN